MLAWLVSSNTMGISEAKPPAAIPASPLVVLIKGASQAQLERPVFVLYASGLVLFQKADGFAPRWDGRYFSVTLTPAEVAALLEPFKPGTDFWSLPEVISALPLSAMGFANVLWVRQQEQTKRTTVHGLVLPGGLQEIPSAFRERFARLAAYEHPRAAPWAPGEIVVDTFPLEAEYRRGKALPWPRGWPDLHHPRTVTTREGFHRIHLDARLMKDAQGLVEAQGRRGVKINGKRLGIGVREVLPGEDAWRVAGTPPLGREKQVERP